MVAFTQADADRVTGDPIAHALDDLRQACEAAVAALHQGHGWPDTDGRVIAVHRLRNVAQSLLAAFVFHKAVFPSEAFWQTFFQAVPTPAEFTDHYREFDVLVRFAGLQGMFSAAESDLRAIVSRLDPTACGGATAEFASIVGWLFARATTAARFAAFADLVRLTRNTIHTNGVHRPRNNQNVSLTVAGKTYDFIVGQPIEFVDWAFVSFVGRHLLDLLVAVATDPIVRSLPSVP